MRVRAPLMIQDPEISQMEVGRLVEDWTKIDEDHYLDGPVTRIAGPEVPGVPYNHVLEDWFMVNPEKIAEGIRKLAAY